VIRKFFEWHEEKHATAKMFLQGVHMVRRCCKSSSNY